MRCNMNEKQNKNVDPAVEESNEIEALLAEYNGQVTSENKHTYSETMHNDTCCCCDLWECGCGLLTCCSD